MRISLNFSYAESWRDRYALVWAIPATTVGLLGALVLGIYALREFRQLREVRQQVAEVARRDDALRLQEDGLRRELASPQHRELLTKVRFVNTLIGQKRLSLTDLAGRLTEFLPENARLTALELNSKEKEEDYTLRMMIAAKNEEAVETFLARLKDAPDFADVAISNDGFQEETANPAEVQMACTARYLPAGKGNMEGSRAEK
jgi:regulator of replication initiation timing